MCVLLLLCYICAVNQAFLVIITISMIKISQALLIICYTIYNCNQLCGLICSHGDAGSGTTHPLTLQQPNAL